LKSNEEISRIVEILKGRYPDVKTPLVHRNPFELLVATILSAQCTDRQVNAVAPALFAAYPTPEALAAAAPAEVERLVHGTGFYRNKARNIRKCAETLVREHGGRVPESLEALTRLPGVGRKTANVVRSVVFGTPAVVVDTHVGRVARRLGLTAEKDPVKVEFALMECIPETEWNDLGLRFIFFGREICDARRPRCPECPLRALCDYPDKTA
jgi:endonuclease III